VIETSFSDDFVRRASEVMFHGLPRQRTSGISSGNVGEEPQDFATFNDLPGFLRAYEEEGCIEGKICRVSFRWNDGTLDGIGTHFRFDGDEGS